MRFRSLAIRFVAIFLAMSFLGQLAGFFVIKNAINENARSTLRDELYVGEKIFTRVIEQNTHKLTLGAGLLVSDNEFKTAVLLRDDEAISAALVGSGKRIGASMSLFISQNKQIYGAANGQVTPGLSDAITRLLESAEKRGSATSASIVGEEVLQIVVTPVKSPQTVGWVAMIFPINIQLAREMSRLSTMHVSIFIADEKNSITQNSSTSPAISNSELASRAVLLDGASQNIKLGGKEFSSRKMLLAESDNARAYMLLSSSVDESIESYRNLQFILLLLTLLNIGIIIGGSLLTAKKITDPLKNLSDLAKRLGNGDFEGHVESHTNDEIGDLSRAFVVMRNGLSAREVEINRLAYTDAITNLPNRLSFTRTLAQTIQSMSSEGVTFCVLMMDLDRFKHVNDVLGHVFGDALLGQVGERLQRMLAKEQVVARLGGDEFAMLLPGTVAAEAHAFAEKILKAMEEPLLIEGHYIDVGAGIGIASYPQHGGSPHLLLSRAEIAMYEAKQRGNVAMVFNPELDITSQDSLTLLSDLRKAIDDNQFKLYVQPKLNLKTGALVGVEALIRWAHPINGMVFPDKFIPFAEKTGFIRTLTLWVLEQAAIFSKMMTDNGVPCKISVNLSARDLSDPDLPAKFMTIINRYDALPSSFCLEITESTIMDDPVRAQQTLESLNSLGVELSIDDFGTGYSSLAYLKRLPVCELKIDKSFVMNMVQDVDDAKIVRSTIDLGHNMGLRVVAEGVESKDAWVMLSSMGCDQGQGYFMSKPMPSDKLLDWIVTWTPPDAS